MLNSVFDFGKELIALRLTDTELALLCAMVLINPSKADSYTVLWHPWLPHVCVWLSEAESVSTKNLALMAKPAGGAQGRCTVLLCWSVFSISGQSVPREFFPLDDQT